LGPGPGPCPGAGRFLWRGGPGWAAGCRAGVCLTAATGRVLAGVAEGCWPAGWAAGDAVDVGLVAGCAACGSPEGGREAGCEADASPVTVSRTRQVSAASETTAAAKVHRRGDRRGRVRDGMTRKPSLPG